MWYVPLYYQAAAYYYHGLILDKGNEPSCHVSAVCCFLAAEEILSESKKACLTFCLAAPVTRLILTVHIYHMCRAWKSSSFALFFFSCSSTYLWFVFSFLLNFKGSSTLGSYEAFASENSWSCNKEISDVWLPLRTREVRAFLSLSMSMMIWVHRIYFNFHILEMLYIP